MLNFYAGVTRLPLSFYLGKSEASGLSDIGAKMEALQVLNEGDIMVKRNTIYLPPHRKMTAEEKQASVYLAFNVGYGISEKSCVHCKEEYGLYDSEKGIVCGVCYDENEIAKKAFENVGFKREGRKRKQCFYNGEYKDTIFMGILSDELK